MARAGEPVYSGGSDVWVLIRPPDIGKSCYWNRRTNSTTWVALNGLTSLPMNTATGISKFVVRLVRHIDFQEDDLTVHSIGNRLVQSYDMRS